MPLKRHPWAIMMPGPRFHTQEKKSVGTTRRIDEALKLYQEALETMIQAVGPSHVGLVLPLLQPSRHFSAVTRTEPSCPARTLDDSSRISRHIWHGARFTRHTAAAMAAEKS